MILLLVAALLQEQDLSALGKAVQGGDAKAAATLARTKEGGLLLIDLAAREKLPAAVRGPISAEIFKNPDLGVRALAAQWFKRPGKPDETIAQVRALKGDAKRGAGLFKGEKAACAKCHSFRGNGGDVGPDLSEIPKKYDSGEILYNILDPSAAVSFGYEATLIKTKSDKIVSGVVLGDGEEVILKDANGELVFVESAEIAARKELEKSLMPDNVALGLSPQDLADLLAYLTSPK